MAGGNQHPIVNEALALLARDPDMPAAEVIRRAVREHPAAGPDFASSDPADARHPHPCYPDELYPPGPFAELLRRAYLPDLDPREALLLWLIEQDQELSAEILDRAQRVADRWQLEVVEPFFRQYDLGT